MRVLRKINNNTAVCIDSAGRELIAMGRGLGFGALPKEVPLREVERTFYDVNSRYLAVLRELPPDVVAFAAKIMDIARSALPYELSPNAVFTLADHLSFTLERARRGIHVQMPLAYDVEQLYPVEYKLGKQALELMRKQFGIGLAKDEATGIAMNLLNARMGEDTVGAAGQGEEYADMLEDITEIVERKLSIIVDRDSFSYSRYATHLQYLFERVRADAGLCTDNLQLYKSLREEFPAVADCVETISAHMEKSWRCRLSEEEKLYLILHVNRICVHE